MSISPQTHSRQLYRTDAYAQAVEAKVVAINERGGIVLDQTPFYAASGGQPGDRGTLISANGPCPIATTVYDTADKATVVHVPQEGATLPSVGDTVQAQLDWAMRHKHMRMHSALHLLCSLVKFPVTGGQIGADEGRLDFDIDTPSSVEKDPLTEALNRLIAADHPITEQWITDAELEANPALVRTLSVKPPMGSGRVRLVLIGADGIVDRQPCGGTHVRSTAEIGAVQVLKIEKKGRMNRRIRIGWQ
jgi:misacylated tRNA(Ala) deacylase